MRLRIARVLEHSRRLLSLHVSSLQTTVFLNFAEFLRFLLRAPQATSLLSEIPVDSPIGLPSSLSQLLFASQPAMLESQRVQRADSIAAFALIIKQYSLSHSLLQHLSQLVSEENSVFVRDRLVEAQLILHDPNAGNDDVQG